MPKNFVPLQQKEKYKVMNTTSRLTNKEVMALEAYWTLLRPLSHDARRELAGRLERSLEKDNNMVSEQRNIRLDAALNFVKTLSVKGGQPVPADACGMDAFVNEKYRL